MEIKQMSPKTLVALYLHSHPSKEYRTVEFLPVNKAKGMYSSEITIENSNFTKLSFKQEKKHTK